MKKLICFLSLSLVLASCSSDDSVAVDQTVPEEEIPGTILLKKMISEGVTTVYTYDGNKILKAESSDNTYEKYTYTGNLITKVEFFEADELIQTNTYTYNSDAKVATFLRVEHLDNLGSKEVYVYNADGTITVNNLSGNAVSQTFNDGTHKIIFENGEVKLIQKDGIYIHAYTYDLRNNPTKNVLGMDKISYTDGDADGIDHNIAMDEGRPGVADDLVNAFEYNADNFPTKINEHFEGEVVVYVLEY